MAAISFTSYNSSNVVGDITLRITDELMSAPYVLMTINLMRKYQATVSHSNNQLFKTSPSKYISPKEIYIEGDASSASYFLAGAAITGGPITVYGCGADSIQGDARFADVSITCLIRDLTNSVDMSGASKDGS